MPKNKKTHDECRSMLCVICFKKSKSLRKISAEIVTEIKKHIESYDSNNIYFPSVICPTCRISLNKQKIGAECKTLDLFSYTDPIISHSTKTRSVTDRAQCVPNSDSCECFLCQAAKVNITSDAQKTFGRPPSAVAPSNSDSQSLKLCSQCLGPIEQGKKHECQKRKRVENLLSLAQSTSPTLGEKVASSVVKAKLFSQNNSDNVQLCNTNKRQKKTSLNFDEPSTSRRKLFLAEDFSHMQINLNLSNRSTLKLSRDIKSVCKVESNLKDKLKERESILNDMFEMKEISYAIIEKNEVKERVNRWTVYVQDINMLIDRVVEYRNLQDDYMVKIGIDGGGGFLKICLSVFKPNSTNDEYAQATSLPALKFLDSGVKKALLISIVPDLQENYSNVKHLWLSTGLHKLKKKFTIAADLKLCNILLGLMAHGSSHPCCWCDIHRSNLVEKGENRTFKSLKEGFWNFFDIGRKRNAAKKFKNVVNPSIIDYELEDDTPTLQYIPPPELHLLTGPFNTIYKAMNKMWSESSDWLKTCHVEREAVHGGSFTGNSCMKLLSKINLLEQIAPENCHNFINTFKTFKNVVDSCYGNVLTDNFETCITDFKSAYLKLGISITPKVHAVFHHVLEFCKKTNSGLGPYSEQTSEAIHADFSKTWNNYKVKDMTNPNFKSQLIRAVQAYNSRHM